uniref:Transmembrane protein n=1 Tax=Panagrolaimus superbus TaxID=310955 RepID=A0A914Y536_9BILA
MACFRSLLFLSALAFGIFISNAYGASLKSYDPYGVNKRLSTTPPPSNSPYQSNNGSDVGPMVKDDTDELQIEMVSFFFFLFERCM